MLTMTPQTPSVVSARMYGLILSSQRLRRMLLPEGLVSSPYEILDYDATLTLHDPKGKRATLRRQQQIRFLQNGVRGILDHGWGDGVLTTSYDNSAGSLEDCFRDGGRRHWLISMKRAMGKGETLTFDVEREIMVAFGDEKNWLETAIDHPIAHERCQIVFPKERACREAVLEYGDQVLHLPVNPGPQRETSVRFALSRPQAQMPATIRWSW